MESSNNFKRNLDVISQGSHYKRNEYATDFVWDESDNVVRVNNSDGMITFRAEEILMVARELLNEFDPLKKWYQTAEEVVAEIVKRWDLIPESIRSEGFSVCPDGLECLIESFVSADDARMLMSYGPSGPSGVPSLGMMVEDVIRKKLTEDEGINVIEDRNGSSSYTTRYHYESVDLFLNYTFLNPTDSRAHGPGMYNPQELKEAATELIKKINDKVNIDKASGALYNILKLGSDILGKWDYSAGIYSMNPYSDNYIAILNWMACMDELSYDEVTSTLLEYECMRNHIDAHRRMRPGMMYEKENHRWDFEGDIAENLHGLIYKMTEAIYNYISVFGGDIKMLNSRSKLEELSGNLFSYYQF